VSAGSEVINDIFSRSFFSDQTPFLIEQLDMAAFPLPVRFGTASTVTPTASCIFIMRTLALS